MAAGRATQPRLPRFRRRGRLDHRHTIDRVLTRSLCPQTPAAGRPSRLRHQGAIEMPPARQFQGAFTALVTPFTTTGAIDEDAFRSLVRRQIASGIHGLVACGTTGETPTLSQEELSLIHIS